MTTIELAIEQLVKEVAVRQDAIRALQEVRQPSLRAGDLVVRPEGKLPGYRLTEKGAQAVRASAARGSARRHAEGGNKVKAQTGGLAVRVMEACAACAEPFDQNTVAAQVGKGVTELQVRGVLAYKAKTGVLKVIEAGRPGHPGKYALANGAQKSRGKRVTVPGLDAPEASLERKLETALKERDQAVSAGEETLARILQDKVNDLQARLEKSKRLDGKA